MTDKFNFRWQTDALKLRMHNASRTALSETAADAKGIFDSIVPVGKTGKLRDSWFSYVDDTGGFWVMLVIGYGGKEAPYAQFLEYGTRKVAARGTLRQTAMLVFPIIPERLREALSMVQE